LNHGDTTFGFEFVPGNPFIPTFTSSDEDEDFSLDGFIEDIEDCMTPEMLQRHIVRGESLGNLIETARATAIRRYRTQHVEISTTFLMLPGPQADFIEEIRRKNRDGTFADSAPGMQTTDRAYPYYERNNRTGDERVGAASFRYNVIQNGRVKVFGHLISIAPGGRVMQPARRVAGHRLAATRRRI